MKCANIFCIFHKDDGCKLPEATLDDRGVCTDCILLPVSQKAIDEHNENLKNMWAELKKRYPPKETVARAKKRKEEK